MQTSEPEGEETSDEETIVRSSGCMKVTCDKITVCTAHFRGRQHTLNREHVLHHPQKMPYRPRIGGTNRCIVKSITRQSNRRLVRDIKVHPQPALADKLDSDELRETRLRPLTSITSLLWTSVYHFGCSSLRESIYWRSQFKSRSVVARCSPTVKECVRKPNVTGDALFVSAPYNSAQKKALHIFDRRVFPRK